LQLALLQVAQHRTNSGRLGRLCPEAWPGVLVEVKHLRGTTTCPREGLGKAGGGWVFLPPWRAGWHMGSSSVPPRDPQAQTPFPSPPGARRMDFFDGARAPRGVRRALVCARGGSQQGADLPCTRLAESRSAVWQVLGGSQRYFSMVPNAAKGARWQQKIGGLSTRGGGWGPTGAARLPV